MADRRRTCRERNAARAPRLAASVLTVLAGTTLAAGQFSSEGPDEKGGAPALASDPMDRSRSQGDGVRVNEHLIVELHVKDEDLANVLQMLSIQSQINIIASRNVSATVSADLYGATFYEALDAILHVNGYGYIQKGNFIYVYTTDELEAIQDANRVRVNKVIHLDYLNAADAAEFAKPLLSDKGQMTTTGRTPDFSLSSNAPSGKDDFALGAVLVVNDYEENVQAIEELVKQIDSRPSQVLVEATVLQTKLTEDNAFGIDFTVLGSLDMADFTGIGGPLKAVEGLVTGAGGRLVGGSNTAVPVPNDNGGGAGTVSVGNTGGPAGLKIGIVSGDVAAFLRVLDEVTDTTVISRPNILTLNRQPARVLVGTKVGYVSTTSTDTSTTQTVQFLDTGTQLYFRPFVSRDGMIRMELKPQVSNATIRDVTNAGGSVVTIPDENTSELSTNVIVRDGNTIVLGGLFTENTRATRRQVPFLGDLPIVGIPFRGKEDSIDRSEIIFMIKPTIVNDQVLMDQGTRASAYVNHTRAGAREGLLIWSRERQSARLLVEADRKERAGDTEGALYCVERSLGLSPAQPEAIAMRERLSAKKKSWPTRSKLDIIIGRESEKALAPARAPDAPVADPAAFGLSGAAPHDQSDARAPVAAQPGPAQQAPAPAQARPPQPPAREPTGRSTAARPAESQPATPVPPPASAPQARGESVESPLENETGPRTGDAVMDEAPFGWLKGPPTSRLEDDDQSGFDVAAASQAVAAPEAVQAPTMLLHPDEADAYIGRIAAQTLWAPLGSEKNRTGSSSGRRAAPACDEA